MVIVVVAGQRTPRTCKDDSSLWLEAVFVIGRLSVTRFCRVDGMAIDGDVFKSVVSLTGESAYCGRVDGSGVLVEIGNDRCFLVSAKHVFSEQLRKGVRCGLSTVRFTPERRDGKGGQEVKVEIEWPDAVWDQKVVDGKKLIPDEIVVVEVTNEVGAIEEIVAVNHTGMDRNPVGSQRRGVCGEAEVSETVWLTGFPTSSAARGAVTRVTHRGRVSSSTTGRDGVEPEVVYVEVASDKGFS